MPQFKGTLFAALLQTVDLVLTSFFFVLCCAVRVKWGKQKFDDIDLDTDEIPKVFKMQLFSLTGK